MSNFDINEEIDKLVDKLASKLKTQLKSAVAKSEKQILRQYIACQKDTAKSTKTTKVNSSSVSSGPKKTSQRRTGVPPKREIEYSHTSSDDSDSD